MENLLKLRKTMEDKGIDCYIVYSQDPHNSEYVAGRWKSRAWLTGFDGSAGTALVTKDEAILWTDGRYFIQAENQIANTGFKLCKMNIPGYPTITEYLKNNMATGATIGFDGTTLSSFAFYEMKNTLKDHAVSFKFDDLIDEIWSERPKYPSAISYEHKLKYAGISRVEKIDNIRKKIEENGGSDYILTTLDDIAWLFNLRGADIDFSPVTLAYAHITMESATIYLNTKSSEKALIDSLKADGIKVVEYTDFINDISKISPNGAVLADEKSLSISIENSLDSAVKVKYVNNITAFEKAKKSSGELENIKLAHLRDGVAMVKTLKWIEDSVGSLEITELDVESKLKENRSLGDNFVGESFNSIVGFGDHGAMMHYRATEESNYVIKEGSTLLIDSGGLYFDGTTDITRTLGIGEVSDEIKRDYTLVLKGMMNLSKAKFLKGTVGSSLDILARQFLWDQAIDYKCGTGHGVGYFLNVHEGPQGIANRPNKTPLEIGMILTNEPGVYRDGKHGIRIENTLVVQEFANTEFGEFYQFENLTLCPIDKNLIVRELMSNEEMDMFNNYHKKVYEALSPLLSEEEQKWLKEKTDEL